jgi:hypothetical protein
MAKTSIAVCLLPLWMSFLLWLGIGLWMGFWSYRAKHEQYDRMSRAIGRGVVDVEPYVSAGLEPHPDDPLDIAVRRLCVNPSAASRAMSYGLGIHLVLSVVVTVIALRPRIPVQETRIAQ